MWTLDASTNGVQSTHTTRRNTSVGDDKDTGIRISREESIIRQSRNGCTHQI
jgi:hypothetical protein